MSVLVDSSIWVAYFRDEKGMDALEWLIDEGLVAINDLILAELMPPIALRRLHKLATLLEQLPKLSLNIDWSGITELQLICLRNGINKVGIPDLIIAQNAMQHSTPLLTTDKHFHLLAKHVSLTLQ